MVKLSNSWIYIVNFQNFAFAKQQQVQKTFKGVRKKFLKNC